VIELFIKDLIVEGKHGVQDSEKLNPQDFKISVHITWDKTEPNISDKLEDTLNWSMLRKQIIEIVQINSFNLMERLAQEISTQLLIDKRIKKLIVNIEKINAYHDCVPGVKLITEVP
jgi:dihydroneopterin aldolase